MADLGTLTITLGVNAQGLMVAETKVKQFAEKIKKTAATITPAMQEPFALFSKSAIGHLAMTSQRLRTFGYLASAAITAPMVLAGKSIMKMASEYEFSMQKIVGLTGTAQNVVDQWSGSIQSMSRDFGRKPQELAEALYFIASSGIEGAQALDVLKMSAKAAATGLGDTQVVANYLTSVLNAYRGTGLTAAYATDVLVAAVREGKAEATGFASAMGSLTPIASALGVSIDQVAGAMAAITLTGSTAAQSATYLRGVFNVLMKETEQGATAMNEATAALGQMKTSYGDLRKILREQGIMVLMQRLNELSAAYGETLVSEVFPNIRAMLGVLSLSGKNMQYNSQIIKEITNSSGSLGKAFAAVADTIKMRYDKAISGLQVSMISLGKSLATTLLPILEGLVKRIDSYAKRFDAMTEAQKRFRIITALVVAGIGPFVMALSVLGYALVGVMNMANGLIKVLTTLNGVLTLLGISTAKAGAKFMVLRKIVNLKNFLGGGVGKVLTALKNPWVLAATGAVTATVAISKYAKKIKQIASDNETFNKSMVKVNESMKRFKDLSSIDYESMSLDELVTARNEARKVWDDAFKLYKQYEKNLEAPMQSNRINKKLMEDQAKKVDFAKRAYDALGVAIENYQAKFSADRSIEQADAEQKVVDGIKEHDQALSNVWKTMLAEVSAAEEQAKINAILGVSFDLAREKADIFLRTIETLVGKDYKLGIDSTQIQTLMDNLKKLNIDLSELKKATDDYNSSLAAIKMKESLLGPTFDADTERLNVYQKYLDEIIETLSKKKPGEVTLIDRQSIDDQLKLIEETKKRIEATTDAKTLNLLKAEADAFGTLSAKIEVVNFTLQATEKAFKDALRGTKGKSGIDPLGKEAQDYAKKLVALQGEIINLQNAQDLKWLEEMNAAFIDGSRNADLIAGAIDALQNKMRFLSETNQIDSFNILAEELKKLENTEEIINILTSSFTDFFSITKEGFENFNDYIKEWVSSLMKAFQQLLAQKISQKIVAAIIPAQDKIKPAKDALALVAANELIVTSEAMRAAALSATIPVTKAAAIAAGQLAVNLAAASAAWIPFPGNIAAVATAVAAVVGSITAASAGIVAASSIGLEKGGIVPEGYPNDSFPARLTSGEAIIPLQNLDKYNFGGKKEVAVLEGEVVFEIAGDVIVGILRKAHKKNSIY